MNEAANRRRLGSASVPVELITWVGPATATDASFDTGIRIMSTMTFEVDAVPSWRSWCSFAICNVQGSSYTRDNVLYVQKNSVGDRFDVVVKGSYTGAFLVQGTRYKLVFDHGWHLGGTDYFSGMAPYDTMAGSTLVFGGVKIYGVKIWDNGVLISDLCPAILSGVYGLWDKVRKIFVTEKSGKTITGE